MVLLSDSLGKRKIFYMNLYVGNLSDSTTGDTLKTLFSEFGGVENVKVIKDRFTGKPKGFAFIEMPNNSEADKATKALNGKLVNGNFIKIKHADSSGKKRKKKSARRRSY